MVKILKHHFSIFLLVNIVLNFLFREANAQESSINYSIESQTSITTNKQVPFWMRSNKFGSIPLAGISQGIVLTGSKEYTSTPSANNFEGDRKLIDWGFNLQARANIGENSNLKIIQGSLKGKFWIFQLQAGRTNDVMGLNGDTALTSGNFSVSGNALGIPKIDLSIPEYYSLPIFDGLFAFKGNFVHGWLGRTKILDSIPLAPPSKVVYYIEDSSPKSYIHQKSLYGRFGKQNWRFKLYGGFNHQVYWGNEQAAYGSNFKLSPLSTFFHVVTGKSYGADGVPTSKIGNQLGSIDLAIEYGFDNFTAKLYRQQFYDVGALSKLGNINDGLNGITIINKNYSSTNDGFNWKALLFEVFYSKDQAGYPWSVLTKSGDEDYYNNFYYVRGWSYNDVGVGNPLITPKSEARDGQASSKFDYFINNRVVAYHLGLKGSINAWSFLTKMTFSRNYGTFGTSKYGNSTGTIRSPQEGNLFKPVNQVSLYLESERELSNGYSFGYITALDNGKLLDNSIGFLIKIKKNF